MYRRLAFVAIFALVAVQLALAEFDPPPEPITGTPPFGSFGGGPFDVVNLANLNVHFGIPIVTKAGRGTPFDFIWAYDSSIWYPAPDSNYVWTWTHRNFGWRVSVRSVPSC